MVVLSTDHDARPVAKLQQVPRSPAGFAIFITAVAGYLDALGYVQLSHLYVSFMSGNSTHFGMSIAAANWTDVALAGLVIGAFVFGSFAGAVLKDHATSRPTIAVLGGELVVLALALVVVLTGGIREAFVVVAVAMGMQNSVHQVISGADVGKSFITGALYGLGEALAHTLSGKRTLREALTFASSWIVFVAGVIAGSLVLAQFGVAISLASIVALLAAALVLVTKGSL